MLLKVAPPSLVQQIPAHVPAGNKNNGFSSVGPVKNAPALAVRDARVAFSSIGVCGPSWTSAQSPLNRPDWQSPSLMYRDQYGQPVTPTKPRTEPGFLSDRTGQDNKKTPQLRSSRPQQKSVYAAKTGKAPTSDAQRWRNPAASGHVAHPGYLMSSEPDLRHQPKPFVSKGIQASLNTVQNGRTAKSLKKAIPASMKVSQKIIAAAPQVPTPTPAPAVKAASNMPQEQAPILLTPRPLHQLARQNLPVAGRVITSSVNAAAPTFVNETLAQRSGNIEYLHDDSVMLEMKQSNNVRHLMERLDKLPPTKIESLKDQLNKLEEKLLNAEDLVAGMQIGPEASATKRTGSDLGGTEFTRSKVKRLIDFFESR